MSVSHLFLAIQFAITNAKIDRVLYPESRIKKIAEAASQKNPIVALEDRIGLVGDTTALAQAGLAKTSSSLSLIKSFAWEQKCTEENAFPSFIYSYIHRLRLPSHG